MYKSGTICFRVPLLLFQCFYQFLRAMRSVKSEPYCFCICIVRMWIIRFSANFCTVVCGYWRLGSRLQTSNVRLHIPQRIWCYVNKHDDADEHRSRIFYFIELSLKSRYIKYSDCVAIWTPFWQTHNGSYANASSLHAPLYLWCTRAHIKVSKENIRFRLSLFLHICNIFCFVCWIYKPYLDWFDILGIPINGNISI